MNKPHRRLQTGFPKDNERLDHERFFVHISNVLNTYKLVMLRETVMY